MGEIAKFALKILANEPRGVRLLAIEVATEDDVAWAVGEILAISQGVGVIAFRSQLPVEPLDRAGWEALFADIKRRIVPRHRVAVPEHAGLAN